MVVGSKRDNRRLDRVHRVLAQKFWMQQHFSSNMTGAAVRGARAGTGWGVQRSFLPVALLLLVMYIAQAVAAGKDAGRWRASALPSRADMGPGRDAEKWTEQVLQAQQSSAAVLCLQNSAAHESPLDCLAQVLLDGGLKASGVEGSGAFRKLLQDGSSSRVKATTTLSGADVRDSGLTDKQSITFEFVLATSLKVQQSAVAFESGVRRRPMTASHPEPSTAHPVQFDSITTEGRRASHMLDIEVVISADDDEGAIAIARDLKGKLDSGVISRKLQEQGLDMSAKLSDSMSQPTVTNSRGKDVSYNANGDIPVGLVLGIVIPSVLMVGGLIIAYIMYRREQAEEGRGSAPQDATVKTGGEWRYDLVRRQVCKRQLTCHLLAEQIKSGHITSSQSRLKWSSRETRAWTHRQDLGTQQRQLKYTTAQRMQSQKRTLRWAWVWGPFSTATSSIGGRPSRKPPRSSGWRKKPFQRLRHSTGRVLGVRVPCCPFYDSKRRRRTWVARVWWAVIP